MERIGVVAKGDISMRDNIPGISVIMGVFNAENSVERSIQSIVDQTFTNWEFIICDDGSIDNTLQILRKYEADPRFRIIKNDKNMGLGAALNNCIRYSKGQFLARQDADDYSNPDRLERQLGYLKKNKHITVLGTQISLFDSDGNHWGINTPISPDDPWEWVKGSKVVHASVLMRSDFIKKIGGYDSSAIRAEDHEMWIRVLSNKGVIKTIPEVLYNVYWDWLDYKRVLK
jgi:glycosyltransferase EpsE